MLHNLANAAGQEPASTFAPTHAEAGQTMHISNSWLLQSRARARERERDSPVGMGMFGGVSPRYSPDPYQVAVNNWGVSHLFQRTPCSEIDIDSSDSDEPEWPTSAIFCIAHPNTTTWSTSCSRPAQRTEKLRRSDSLLSSERG